MGDDCETVAIGAIIAVFILLVFLPHLMGPVGAPGTMMLLTIPLSMTIPESIDTPKSPTSGNSSTTETNQPKNTTANSILPIAINASGQLPLKLNGLNYPA
ncbi:hypothetical protein Dimus_033141 [Dionaea muscipula]